MPLFSIDMKELGVCASALCMHPETRVIIIPSKRGDLASSSPDSLCRSRTSASVRLLFTDQCKGKGHPRCHSPLIPSSLHGISPVNIVSVEKYNAVLDPLHDPINVRCRCAQVLARLLLQKCVVIVVNIFFFFFFPIALSIF